SNFQSNAGNGFSNGFSSNHGTMNSSIAGSRQAATPSNSVFLSQLLEKAEMIKTTEGKKVLSLELDPKELGKMEMELTSKDGTVTAKISAENELAKLKLEELSQQIKEQLNSQGINLTEITVDISSRQPDERNKNQMSDGKNKSNRTESLNATDNEQIISKNILPNLRKVALNIQSVDLTV
ncbi:MAG: Flagellar hook-length control protein FliK, partial [Clostridiales bacterium]|nr:Flagellar hook-length control protein FliK [Clostridiales bacterium]MDN5281371.1 Flagellar hook-length control protein FliK [Candidatus Ozemobacter sp.]